MLNLHCLPDVYEANHPPDQLPYDASKKTIVILGSGWGSTALLDSIDTTEYNVVVISPYNYFLFTPLLPSVTVGTLNSRSITQPTRYIVRYKTREVQVLEAHATKIDAENKTVTFEDRNSGEGEMGSQEIKYDYLVYAVGSENQTFGIEGVKKHGLFLKELGDAEQIRRRLMDWWVDERGERFQKGRSTRAAEDEQSSYLHYQTMKVECWITKCSCPGILKRARMEGAGIFRKSRFDNGWLLMYLQRRKGFSIGTKWRGDW